MSDWTQKQEAEAVVEFLKTQLGERYLTAMSLMYNQLHQEAEGKTMTAEQKAFKVERAAGVKLAIDWLSSRKALLEQGYFDEPKEKPGK